MELRVVALRRMTKLYGVIEQMRQRELERAATDVREVDVAIELQKTAMRSARFDGREALAGDNRLDLQIAETRIVIAVSNAARLEPLRASREQIRNAVCEHYLQSKLQSEQMKQVRDIALEGLRVEEERRVQATTDDLFLSRQQWLRRQNELRGCTE